MIDRYDQDDLLVILSSSDKDKTMAQNPTTEMNTNTTNYSEDYESSGYESDADFFIDEYIDVLISTEQQKEPD